MRREIVVLCVFALGCTVKVEREADTTSRRQQMAVSRAPDTAIITSPGVPTDADDTMPTSYQKHQTPRPVPAPDCLPTGIALCIADTARTLYTYPSINDEHQTEWLVFAAAQDSMQLFVMHPSFSHISMSPFSAAGFGAEHSTNDASWIRPRFPRAGAYVLTAGIESDSSAAYQLRVVPVIATGASQPTGASATLTLSGDSSARIAVAPAAMASRRSAPEIETFGVRPGTYKVLLVRDTDYVECRLPCADRKHFLLHADQRVTVGP